MEGKRKTHTSTVVKQRYNNKTYKKITVQVRPDLASRIQAYKEKEAISMAEFLARAMDALEE